MEGDGEYFIKSPNSDDPFVGRTMSGLSVFPDFVNPVTEQNWHQLLQRYQEQLPFDGLQLIMNEATNYCNGSCLDSQRQTETFEHYLAYVPTGRSLSELSISMASEF